MRTINDTLNRLLTADCSVRETLKSLLSDPTDNAALQLLRYTFVGGAAFVLDFSTLFMLTESVGIHYLISAAIAFIVGLTTNYSMSVIWVFNKHTIQNRLAEFLLFAAIGLLGLCLNEVFLWFFTEKVALYYLLSKIISTILVYLFNFTARKAVLFR